MTVSGAWNVEVPEACSDQRVARYEGPSLLPVLPAHVEGVGKIKICHMCLCPPEDESYTYEYKCGK